MLKMKIFELTKDQLVQEKVSKDHLTLFTSWFGSSVTLQLDHLTSVMIATSEIKDFYAWLVTKRLVPPLQLSYADLTNADLTGGNFTWANLQYAKLNSALLDNCDFKNADFYNAKLRKSRGNNSNFSGAKMGYAKLSNAIFDNCDFMGVYLYGADITNLKLGNSSTKYVSFANTIS